MQTPAIAHKRRNPSPLHAHSTAAAKRGKRRLRLEALEGRMMLATLVADALGGTADTTIGGTVYEDLDANGQKNGGEKGIPNWTVFLDLDNSGTLNKDAAGVDEPSALTNVDGDYVIDHLKPGTYTVSHVLPSGWEATGPRSQNVLVRSTKDSVADFFVVNRGVSSKGGITGTIWQDVNGDSMRSTDPVTGEFVEPGLSGWTVFLDLNNNRALDLTEPKTLTDAAGVYSFSDLTAGDYEVVEILPDGWDVSPTFDNKQTVAVVGGTLKVARDFANIDNSNGSIQGTIWNDLNANGIRDVDPSTGEFTDLGLEGWTVYLDVNNNRVLDSEDPTALTDASGSYQFTSLLAGDYEVTEVLPSGWNVSPTFDDRQTVTVEGGIVKTGNDFANFGTLNGSIRGTIWNDLNADGIRAVDPATGEFTDLGLSGWTVYLDLNRNSAQDSSEPATLTDASGGYVFVDLQIGEYEVRETLPAGWETSPTFSDSESVLVFGGTESIAPDFANFNPGVGVPGSVGGVVWDDLDGNGVRAFDPLSGSFTEPGLSGWKVFIDQNANGVLDTSEPSSLTATDGSYTFAGLVPGSVTVIAQVAAGWHATSPLTSTHTVALRSSGNVVGLDFGNQQLKDSTIRGTVYADSDKDGLRDAGERGLAGITVYLDLDNDSILDADEPRMVTSDDLFYTPGVDEAGTYSFTHLAKGTYTIREIIPATLSSTPSHELEHTVTIDAAEDHSGVDSGAVYRPNEIHGIKFEDSNGNHLRDVGEPGIGGVTIFVDLNRDNIYDASEPSTVTLDDGSYTFKNLTPGAYVIREIVTPGYERTYPTSLGGTLWPQGVSNPAVGNVTPSSITASLATGESYRQSVSITLPNTGALTNLVDVFLLFDDTGSFVNNSPIVRSAFPTIISQLQASLPGIDLGFGVGRFEEYANFASEYATGRPFVLNQPIVAASTPGYLTSIQAALNRTTPGYGGDQPETVIEALYQVVTGRGFDGNNNGSVLDSGVAGLSSTQLNPGSSGDVPSFASFTPDAANSVLPAAGNVGGAGFRAGALPIILTATDTGFAYQPNGESVITGLGGTTLPISSLTQTSRGTTPFNSGARIQETITGLNALGALVIGLGTNPQANLDPRQGLEAISKLTGATNQSTSTIANGTTDAIAPGDPLYFQIATGFASSVANGVVSAIQNAVTNVAVNITLQASDPRVKIINHTGTLNGISSGQTASFDVEFVGDGRPHRFDLQFVRAGTNVVLGSIPVVLGTPVPGDGYEFEDLEEGEISSEVDFGNHRSGAEAVNVAPSFTAGTDQNFLEDAGLQTIAAWATSISAGPASEAGQTVQFLTSNNNPALFSTQPTISPEGALSFAPAANAFGTATVTVQLRDNGGTVGGGSDTSLTKTFTISIAAVNDAPTATDDSYSLTEDESLSVNAIAGVLINDSDVEGDTLSAVLGAAPAHGSVVLNADGSFVYTPEANYHGADSFTYQVDDGTDLSKVATVNLTIASVNDAPVAVDDLFSALEDAPLTVDVAGVLANDADRDDDALDVSLVAGPAHGTLALGTTGLFVYTPEANFYGTDSFTYLVNDGQADSNVAVVTIQVASVNDAPVAADDLLDATEDVALVVPAAGLLANDNDIESDALAALLVSGPANGTLALNSDGSLIYTPNANFTGIDSFTYKANDGSLDSGVATVTIRVASVNDAPLATSDNYATDEDQTLVVVAAGVLANDSDIDSSSLAAVLVTGPTNGVLTLNSDGAFSYSPAANFNGSDSFTYRVSDGAAQSGLATVTIRVSAVNDAPVATNDAYVINQATTLALASASSVLANDRDVDGDVLNATVISGPSNGTLTLNPNGSFTYVPLTGFAGVDSFTYAANDGLLASNTATVTIDVRPTPPPPPTPGGTKFIVVDDSARDAFNYDAAGNLVVRHDLDREDEGPRGVTANRDGSRYWVVDGKGEVFVYNQGGQEIGFWKYRGVDKAEGIATDGRDIWIVDRETDRVFYFPSATVMHSGSARPVSNFPLDKSNSHPTDVTTDGKHLWVVDDTSNVDKVFRYSLAGKLEGSWTIDTANSQPTGLTIDPNNVNDIWIVDAGTDRVYRYDSATGRTTGKQSAADSFGLAAGNRNPQGIADPMAHAVVSASAAGETKSVASLAGALGIPSGTASVKQTADSPEDQRTDDILETRDGRSVGVQQTTFTVTEASALMAGSGLRDHDEALLGLLDDLEGDRLVDSLLNDFFAKR